MQTFKWNSLYKIISKIREKVQEKSLSKLCGAIKALTLKRLRGQFEIVEQVIVE